MFPETCFFFWGGGVHVAVNFILLYPAAYEAWCDNMFITFCMMEMGRESHDLMAMWRLDC